MINLEKYEERKQDVKIVLEKHNIPSQKAMVKFFIDCSGSMSTMYSKGEVQEVFERILPLADLLDDDHTMQVYKFNNQCISVGDANINNADGFIGKISAGGGTNYAPIIKSALSEASRDVPTLAIVITDGDCSDERDTTEAIKKASRENVFFQFVGIGYEKFRFLDMIDTMQGRYIDNVGFFKINRLSDLSDKDLYNLLINEFPVWLSGYKAPADNPTAGKGLFEKFFK